MSSTWGEAGQDLEALLLRFILLRNGNSRVAECQRREDASGGSSGGAGWAEVRQAHQGPGAVAWCEADPWFAVLEFPQVPLGAGAGGEVGGEAGAEPGVRGKSALGELPGSRSVLGDSGGQGHTQGPEVAEERGPPPPPHWRNNWVQRWLGRSTRLWRLTGTCPSRAGSRALIKESQWKLARPQGAGRLKKPSLSDIAVHEGCVFKRS